MAAGVALCLATPAFAEPVAREARWTAWASEAGAACEARDLAAAAERLDLLGEEVAAELGRGHAISGLIEIARAQVAAARSTPLKPLPADGPAREPVEVTQAFEAALGPLRACTRVRLPTPSAELSALSDRAEGMAPAAEWSADFATQLAAAHGLARKGQYAAATRAARRANELARAERDAAVRARAIRTLALLQLQVGDFEAAERSAGHAVEAARRAEDPATLIAMARLLVALRQFERAGALLDEAAQSSTPGAAHAAELAEARGDMALALGDPDRAIDAFDRALAEHIRLFGAAHPSTASVHQLRGQAHRMAGDLPAAQRDLREALAIREQHHGEGHPEAARTRNALGIVLADLGDDARADESFRAALAALDRELGTHHPEVITVRANRVLIEWGREHSEVEAFHYGAILDGLAAGYGVDHPITSEARRNLARMQEELGDSEAAEALLDQVLAAQTRALGEGHPSLARTYMARGDFFARAGRYADARRELGEAVEQLRVHHGDEHPLVARARTARALVRIASGQPEAAWRDAREAARVFDLYLQRSIGAMPDRQRVLLAADAARVVGALASLPRSAGVDDRAIYAALIPQRDAVLRSIASDQARRSAEAGDSFASLRKLRERYVAAVLSEGAEAAARARELADAIDSEESVLGLTRGGRRERPASQILHAACQRLPAQAALVEYIAYDRVDARSAAEGLDPQPAYLAMVIRPERAAGAQRADGPERVDGPEREEDAERECRVDRVDLGPAAPIDEAAERFARAMQEQRGDDPAARLDLARLVLDPLRPKLGDADRWWMIPDASLWGVPFAALPDTAGGGKRTRYLIERVVLGTLTSIHELADAASVSPPEEASALLFGAPDFGSAADGAGPRVFTPHGPCRTRPFEPLPGTAQELETLAELLPGARVIQGAHANKQNLLRALDRAPSIVHLATHAYFAGQARGVPGCGGAGAGADESGDANSADRVMERSTVVPNPLLLSGIVLAGANAAGGSAQEVNTSGILTALEASSLDLSAARLVVLSACDTGSGLRGRGQEVLGLRFGFRASGAGALLTSLWRSNDVVTRKLMADFYRALGVPRPGVPDLFAGPRALQLAQRARIESERRLGLTKPLTWANFVFSGVY